MFSKQEKMYIQARSAIGRWNTARTALFAYTTVPAGGGIWEIFTTHNLKLLIPYLLFVAMTVICQAVCSGKVHRYKATVDLLEKRLDLPPPVKST